MNTSLKLSKNSSVLESEITIAWLHAVGAVIMLILTPISSTYSYEDMDFYRFYSLSSISHVSSIYHSMAYGSTLMWLSCVITDPHSMIMWLSQALYGRIDSWWIINVYIDY